MLVGQIMSRYRIVARLGSDGMGVVHKAEDIALDRFVALTFPPDDLPNDAQALERFRREAKGGPGLDHPNISSFTKPATATVDASSPWSIWKARR
jgi:serine/threonine-protein kinase